MISEPKITIKKIKDIKAAAYNPRRNLKPGDKEYEAIKASLSEFGNVQPLVWNEVTGNLVGGHQRLKILKEHGHKECQVSVVHIEDQAKEKALNLALNRPFGEYDFPLLKDVLLDIDTGAFNMDMTGFFENDIESLMTQFHVEAEKKASIVPDKGDNIAIRLFFNPGMWLGKREEVMEILEKMKTVYDCKVKIDE